MKGSGEQFQYKKNISHEESYLSKEELLNKAFKYHQSGNISEALISYQIFIKKGFTDSRVFLNYGIILQKMGKLHEAEIFTRKAINVKPKYRLQTNSINLV